MKFKVGDKVKCIDNEYLEDCLTLGRTYVITEVDEGGDICFEHTGDMLCFSGRFELIKEDSIMEKQFNPKPGDKIICNNGEEFTCCTKEFLFGRGIVSHTDYELYGCQDNTKNYYGVIWMGWPEDGENIWNREWNIREVIPKQKEEIMSEDAEVKLEQSSYTAEDIQNAWDDLNWHDFTIEMLMESLEKVSNPEYKEYLRLKAMFESEQ